MSPASRLPLRHDSGLGLARLWSRRAFLGLGLGVGAAATLALAGCTSTAAWVNPDSAAVRDRERQRGGTGKITAVTLTAASAGLDLAGTTAQTFAYGAVPAPVIRLGAGDTLKATVRNQLPVETSVHWHGLALRNDMDGVPPITQQPIAAGATFDYEFIAPDPGTYWFHPHVGAQLDSGLYGALIVEDPNEPLAYDDEWVIVLDDWLDGVTATPDQVLAELSRGMGDMGGMGDMFMRMGSTLMGATSDLLGDRDPGGDHDPPGRHPAHRDSGRRDPGRCGGGEPGSHRPDRAAADRGHARHERGRGARRADRAGVHRSSHR